jgi:hypothetical protein
MTDVEHPKIVIQMFSWLVVSNMTLMVVEWMVNGWLMDGWLVVSNMTG